MRWCYNNRGQGCVGFNPNSTIKVKIDPDAKDRVLQSERKMKNETRFPDGWNEERVQRLLQHYESQTEEEAVAEDESVWEDTTQTDLPLSQT